MSVSGDFKVICIALGGIFSKLLNSLYIKSGWFVCFFESGRLQDL